MNPRWRQSVIQLEPSQPPQTLATSDDSSGGRCTASIHPRGWCRDLGPTLVNWIILHRIPTTLLHLANDLIYILYFPTDQCHFCLVGGIQHFVWPPEFQQVAYGIWHLYRLEAIQLRNDAVEEKEAMLLE